MEEKTSLKAVLKVVLKANEITVAESSNPRLWQKVLAAINMPAESHEDFSTLSKDSEPQKDKLHKGEPIEEFAQELGVSVTVLKGACDPSEISPFIHLDVHHWEALKKATPARGPKSIPAIVLASTLLALWKTKAKLGDVTVKEVQQVLDTIGWYDKHPYRGLQNCEWLQTRAKNIIINPAQTSKAIALARAYCTKEYGK